MIQISESSARVVLRLLEDIREIDQRARCSDGYFRQHFTMLARLPAVADAAEEINRALEAPEPEAELEAEPELELEPVSRTRRK